MGTHPVQIHVGHKFAAIVLPDVRLQRSFPEHLRLAPDVWATRRSPFSVTPFWRETIGSLAADRLEDANFFLVTEAPSETPDVLDGENEALEDRVWLLYLGMLLSGGAQFGMPVRLTGVQREKGAEVRSLGEIEMPGYTLGARIQPLTEERARLAAEVAEGLSLLLAQPKRKRISRILHAFYAGMTEKDASDRLHQFVRCIEGFIVPATGATARQFKHRTELFVGPRHHGDLGEIYEIRSSVEHLHGPYAAIQRQTGREMRIAALQRAIEAEEIARYCVRTFLLRPQMWQHFDDDAAAKSFWALPAGDRVASWGPPMNFTHLQQSFDPRFIGDEDLGLRE